MSAPDGGAASMLWPAGPAAAAIAEIGWVLIVGAAAVFVAVMLLLAWSLRRPAREPSAVRWVLGGGLLAPVLLLAPLWAYSLWRSAELSAAPPPDALLVSVSGRMWWWELRYRDPLSGRDAVLANELRIPVGRPVRLSLSSEDVIHSLWVPALAGKTDLLPGRITHLRIGASRAGVYRGQCAEYCGAQHAHMALHVVAMPPQEFDAWLARQAAPAAEPTDALQQRGRAAFLALRCDACHALRGLTPPGAAAGLGPDLTHVGSRLHLGAGTLANGGPALRHWIAGVQHLKPGARMPAFEHLDADTLEALAAYLGQLR